MSIIGKYVKQASNVQLVSALRLLNTDISAGRASASTALSEAISEMDSLRGRLVLLSSSVPSQLEGWKHEIAAVLKAVPTPSSAGSPMSPNMGAATPMLGGLTQVGGGGSPTPGRTGHGRGDADCTQIHDNFHDDAEEASRVGGAGDVMCTALNSAFSEGGNSEDESRGSQEVEGREQPNAHKHGSSNGASVGSTIGAGPGGTQICTLPTTQSISHTAIGTLQNPSVSLASGGRPPSSLANRQHSGFDTISSSLIEADLEETAMERHGGRASGGPNRREELFRSSPAKSEGGGKSQQEEEEASQALSECKDYDVDDDDDGVPSVDRFLSGQRKKRRWAVDGNDSSGDDQMSDSQPESSGVGGLM
jgi:hypothetical protein